LELNGTHLLLVYADDVTIKVKNINTIKEDKFLVQDNREVGLEVNTEKTQYMVVSRLLIVYKSCKNMADIKYLGKTVTN